MAFFKVVITEELKKTVLVEAESLEAAEELVGDVYNDGEEIVLGDNDYYGDFETETEELSKEDFMFRKENGTQVIEDERMSKHYGPISNRTAEQILKEKRGEEWINT